MRTLTLTLTLSGLSLGALLGATPARAGVIYDEAINGDFSGDKNAPTVLHFAPGASTFLGSSARGDFDLFRFTLPTSRELVSLTLDVYTGSDDVSFIAFQTGGVWTTGLGGGGVIIPTALLGWAHFGVGTAGPPAIPSTLGTDILDDIGVGGFGSTGFTPPLGGGTYTALIQQTSLLINYQFTAVVRRVPEPSTMALLGLGFGLAGLTVRRRAR